MALKKIGTVVDQVVDVTPVDKAGVTLESVTDTYFTDLICEGPIAGFCDQEGNLIKLNFIDETSGLTDTEIDEHNEKEQLKILQAFYANGVPLMDSLGKINLDVIKFDFSLGNDPKVPGSSIGDPSFYRPNTVFNKKNQLIGHAPEENKSIVVGNYGSSKGVHDGHAYGSAHQSYVAYWKLANFNNAAELAKDKGASPVFHTITNPWIKQISIQFTLSSLLCSNDDGSTSGNLCLISIRVKNEGEEYVSAFNPSNSKHYFQGDSGTDVSFNKGKITNYPRNLIWYSAGGKNSTSGQEILHIYGIASSPFQFDIPITLPDNPRGAKRIIEIVKITPETKPNVKFQDKSNGGVYGGQNSRCFVSLDTITEIYPLKFNYPNSAVITSRYNSASFNSVPQRTFDLKLKKIKIPSNYNPSDRSYNGFWDGTFQEGLHWTDNPAWVFYDIATNPVYGLGKFNISPKNIDKWALYTIAKYCDELVRNGYEGYYVDREFSIESTNLRGINIQLTSSYTSADFQAEFDHVGKKLAIFNKSNSEAAEYTEIVKTEIDGSIGRIITKNLFDSALTGRCSVEFKDFPILEPRFSCNLYITERSEALKILNDLGSIFNGMMCWQGGKISLAHDSLKEPTMLFNNTNVEEGLFDYSGTAKSARFSVVKVAYMDATDNYTRRIEYVEDSDSIIKFGYLEKEVTAFGCTSRGQAHRLAKWILLTDRLESQVVAFKTGIEASLLRCGDVIKIADKNKFLTRTGGRILGVDAANTKIFLDSEVDFEVVGSTVTVITPRANENETSLFLKGSPADSDVENQSAPQITEFEITAVDDTKKILTVAGTDAEMLLRKCPSNSIWAVDVQGDIVDSTPATYRVIGVSQEDQAYGVVASEYNSSKFKSIEEDTIFEKNVLPPVNTDPQFHILKSPNPPTPPLTLTKHYDLISEGSTIISGQWSAPEKLPIDSDGNEVGSVDYVVDYYYKDTLKTRHRIKGKNGISSYADSIKIGKDYGFYRVNVFSEYEGVKSRNFITNSINVPLTGDFIGYDISNPSFSQNSTAYNRYPAGPGSLGEFSGPNVEFSWQVSDLRLPNVYLDVNDLFSRSKYNTHTFSHFNLYLLDENNSIRQQVSNVKTTNYIFDVSSGNMQGSRIAKLKIVSVANSGQTQVYRTGYISGKNYEPEVNSFDAKLSGDGVVLKASVNDSDLQQISVYRTGLLENQELINNDFDISLAEEVYPSQGDSIFVESGHFDHELNRTYYYKLLPIDSFGTGIIYPVTGSDGGMLAFDRSINVTDLISFADDKGNFNFDWEVTDSLGDSVNLEEFQVNNQDIRLRGFQIDLKNDTRLSDVPVSQKTLDTIRFVRDTGDPAVLNRILIAGDHNRGPDGKISQAFLTFYRKEVPYSSSLPTEQHQYIFSNFLNNGSPAAGATDFKTGLSRVQHGFSSQLGVRAFAYDLEQDLTSSTLSGDILYSKSIPRTFMPTERGATHYIFPREENNAAYSAVHSGGFKLSTFTGANLQVTGIQKSVLPAMSGKRSIDFTVKLIDSDLNILTSGRITGFDPPPRISSHIEFDPVTSPGNIIFKNVDYLPGLEEKTIKKVDVYTGNAENIDLDEEHFAFSIDGPFGHNSQGSNLNITSDPNVIIHTDVPIGNTRSTPYFYNFIPYDQFGSGIAKRNVYAYVIDPKRFFEGFDFTAPEPVDDIVVDGGYGDRFFIKWDDSIADDEDDERNKDIDHYEVWQGNQTRVDEYQNSGLKTDPGPPFTVAYSNQNSYVKYTANYTELLLNTDPADDITNASLVGRTKDRSLTTSNTGHLGWFWVRAVDKRGNKSQFYPSGTGEFNRDRTAPEPPTNLQIDAAFKSFFLSWENSPSPDVKEYEIWKSTGQYLQTGNIDVTDNSINTGVLYLDSDNNIVDDPWTGSAPQLVGKVGYPTAMATVTGERSENAYFWIRAADRQGNKSSFANSVTGIDETLGTVGVTDIDDFAIDASKTFTNIPVVSGDSWTDNVGTNGTGISWNAHKLVYSGDIYDISSANTKHRYVYWEKPNNYYSTSSGHPGATLSDTDFIIATNVSGGHDLAWNAIANQVVGSAFIQDAAIERAKIADLAVDNAKIADLRANKIKSETISGQSIKIGPSGGFPGSIQSINFTGVNASGFALSGDGKLHLKGSDGSYLKFANNRLELVGSFINSSTEVTANFGNNYEPPAGVEVATFIGGGYNNDISPQPGVGNATASAIVAGACNSVTGSYTSVGGGWNNVAVDNFSVIGGGFRNCLAEHPFDPDINEGGSFIGGGADNIIYFANYSNIVGGDVNGIFGSSKSSILGGQNNLITGNGTNQSEITIAGGYYNKIHGCNGASFIGGGAQNCINDTSTTTNKGCQIFVGNGCCNLLKNAGCRSFIGNGYKNRICNSNHVSIVNGTCNYICNTEESIIHGCKNNINCTRDSVVLGDTNCIFKSSTYLYSNWVIGNENCVRSNCTFSIGNDIIHCVDGGMVFGSNAKITGTNFLHRGNVILTDNDYSRTCRVCNVGGNHTLTVYFEDGAHFENTALHVGTGVGGAVGNAAADFKGIKFKDYYSTNNIPGSHIDFGWNAFGISVQAGTLAYHTSDHHKFYGDAGAGDGGDIIACISKSNTFTGIYSNYDIVACSDCRGKSDIASIDNALQKVNNLKGRTYITEGSSRRSYGLVAQEVAPVVPELVYSGASGEEYGLKYQNMTALLIEAIKEQSKRICCLESKLKDQS